jgi:hypothetical protein
MPSFFFAEIFRPVDAAVIRAVILASVVDTSAAAD